MNRARTDYSTVVVSEFKFTPYWVLGFIEGEGSFYVRNNKYFTLGFGLGQSVKDLSLMQELRAYLAKDLPIKYGVVVYPKAVSLVETKDEFGVVSSISISIGNISYFKNVFIPFLDSMIWRSKKWSDYQDWMTILQIKELDYHKTEAGIKVINLLINQMNLRRLTTSISKYESTVSLEVLARIVS